MPALADGPVMQEAGIYARESAYLDRFVQVGLATGKVISLSFPTAPDDEAESAAAILDRIDRYLEGSNDDFREVPIALTMPTRQRAVLEALRSVPYGEQRSVERLAMMTPDFDPDAEDDIELVRSALADNPIPLIIPDHRVRDGPSAAPPDVEQKLRSLEGL